MRDAVGSSGAAERISDALRRLLREADGRPLTIREMIEILHGRGLQFVVILLCLPFLAPVTVPGISIPFGLAIALCGLRIAFGHKPWLPAFILNRTISYSVLERMVHFGCAIYEKVEKVVRPRLGFLLAGPGMGMMIGSAIALSGVFLSLPIPPPFPLTNTIPGFAIICLSLGLMERDGGLILCGYLLTSIAAIYVALIALLGKAGVDHLLEMFKDG
ncbi:MAG TPA: exopolysaccharide biosynthesis protein [Terrimicrobiaceae bacterium]|nr:exopolysaccharide biosynthesis protein [Terrimicrobiaceae bacterium]